MKGSRAAIVALVVLGVGILGFAGISLSTMAGVVGAGADYDMDLPQVKAFVATAALKRDWKPTPAIERSANPKPGEEQVDYSAPLLPWMTAHVRVDLSPVKGGTHVMISGHAKKVSELKSFLDRQLPAQSLPSNTR